MTLARAAAGKSTRTAAEDGARSPFRGLSLKLKRRCGEKHSEIEANIDSLKYDTL